MIRPFHERLQPAVNRPVFERNDHYVWCPSVIRDEAGRYHLFVST